jgi:hypothetical protein
MGLRKNALQGVTGYLHLPTVIREQVLEVFRTVEYFVSSVQFDFTDRPIPDTCEIPQPSR